MRRDALAAKMTPALSIGRRGSWLTVGLDGRRVTVGWAGTGLSWTERLPPAPAPHAGHRSAGAELGYTIVALCALAVLLAA